MGEAVTPFPTQEEAELTLGLSDIRAMRGIKNGRLCLPYLLLCLQNSPKFYSIFDIRGRATHRLLPADLDKPKTVIAGGIPLLDESSLANTPTVAQILAGMDYLCSLAPKAVLFRGGADGAQVATAPNFLGKINLVPIGKQRSTSQDSLHNQIVLHDSFERSH